MANIGFGHIRQRTAVYKARLLVAYLSRTYSPDDTNNNSSNYVPMLSVMNERLRLTQQNGVTSSCLYGIVVFCLPHAAEPVPYASERDLRSSPHRGQYFYPAQSGKGIRSASRLDCSEESVQG